MAKCKSCGAEIIWMKTINGKNIPVDMDEDLKDDTGKFPAEFDADRMTTHFETCPDAKSFRR
jgi:hypothetical protein